jgi:ABC-type dipeptide/oligopeptide/nickel transport system ATPase component
VSPAARAVDLVKTYGRGDAVVHAINGITVEFERGRFTAVMGPSGSGKSTLMHCMAGLDTPSSGRTFVGDQEIGLMDDAALTQMRRDRIGFVFQSFNLVPTLTTGENITLPADLAGTKVDREWFDYLVGQLGIGDRLDHRPNDPTWYSPTNPPGTWTPMHPPRCSNSSGARSTSSTSRSSWSPTTPAGRPSPTGSSSSPTARWWAD